jgi:hypothetical protein
MPSVERSWAAMRPSCCGSRRKSARLAVIAVSIVIVFPVIAITAIAVPPMVVLEAAPIAIPVATIKLLTLIAGHNPARAAVRGTRPIPVVPPITASVSKPVAVYPDIVRAGTRRVDANHSRRWRWPDPNSDSDLGATDR